MKTNFSFGGARGCLRRIVASCSNSRAPLLKSLIIGCATLAAIQTCVAGIPEPDLVWYGKVVSTASGSNVRLTTGTLTWQIEPFAGGPAFLVATTLTNVNDQFSYVLRVPCESPEPGVTASTNVINLATPANRYRRLTVRLDGELLSFVSASNEISPTLSFRGRSERVDLHLGSALVDSDNDGLADAWEMQHFGSLSASPDGDPDGDGVNNRNEYRAGTNPNDAASRFELVEIAKVDNGIAIRWSSQPDRTYRVRRSSTLLASPATYTPVQSGLVATPPMNEFIDTTAGASATVFYIIEIED